MLGNEKEKAFHYLPCKIHYDGPANVSTFFLIEESADVAASTSQKKDKGEEQNEKLFTTTLRGRGLIGKSLSLKNYNIILATSSQLSTVESDTAARQARGEEEEGRQQNLWKKEVNAENTTIWMHDQEPTNISCAAMNIPAWIQLAEAVHL